MINISPSRDEKTVSDCISFEMAYGRMASPVFALADPVLDSNRWEVQSSSLTGKEDQMQVLGVIWPVVLSSVLYSVYSPWTGEDTVPVQPGLETVVPRRRKRATRDPFCQQSKSRLLRTVHANWISTRECFGLVITPPPLEIAVLLLDGEVGDRHLVGQVLGGSSRNLQYSVKSMPYVEAKQMILR